MIRFERVGFRYAEEAAPVLSDVDLEVDEGELCLVVGRTGSGKSTLLRAVNGLVPHFTGGILSGRVTVAGRDTRDHPPRDLADVVGYVGQDPRAGFVTDVVEEELAYGMESLGLAPAVMRRRVEETLDLLGLETVRDRPLATLSGGQAQRVAIGSVLTAHPRALVLDEPTSALDPVGAEDVLAILQRLVHDLALTVVLAEHRLERVVHLADTVVVLAGDGGPAAYGPAAAVMGDAPVAPPVVRLGRAAGWSPLPLSVRDARRAAAPLRARLTREDTLKNDAAPAARTDGAPVATVRGLRVRYGPVPALRGVDLTVARGEVVALMGRNGAGKSSLLSSLVGLVRPEAGRVEVLGAAPYGLRARAMVRRAGLVPQEPADLLYAETVTAECRAADRDMSAPEGTCRALFERLAPGVSGDVHPRDLSEGQRLCLALAVILTGRPPLVLLDEPTRGLDYAAKTRLVEILRELSAEGHAIVLATHDVELAAEVAGRVVVIAEGEVVSDGPTEEVLVSSPAFAPQMSKIFAPLPLLTVAQATAALVELA
ncbi:ABC transporter ATP-binding protein [Actinoallomurus iriomotensis]|uniref:ABC transporter ATP-binding protein n=1 Tax=Actinoallomurus iriomotensis TaxID=478107 RepID=A0A9W6RWE6_9ACTN|nr:ABC transporter ATP-binding protein [Actinoallomurus iriomotensis]GLY82923.1 putative ABC transporter ATP-binding protein [Actinoallomurus iriomotensis]